LLHGGLKRNTAGADNAVRGGSLYWEKFLMSSTFLTLNGGGKKG